VQRQRGLAGGLRPVNLDYAALWHAADAQRHVQRQGASGQSFAVHGDVVAQTHYGALAVVFLYLRYGRFKGLFLVVRLTRSGYGSFSLCGHVTPLKMNFINHDYNFAATTRLTFIVSSKVSTPRKPFFSSSSFTGSA